MRKFGLFIVSYSNSMANVTTSFNQDDYIQPNYQIWQSSEGIDPRNEIFRIQYVSKAARGQTRICGFWIEIFIRDYHRLRTLSAERRLGAFCKRRRYFKLANFTKDLRGTSLLEGRGNLQNKNVFLFKLSSYKTGIGIRN